MCFCLPSTTLTRPFVSCLQLAFADGLLEEHLSGAAAGLAAVAADPATAAGWLEHRQDVRSLAWRLEGAVSGLRSCFVDYEHAGKELSLAFL